VALFEKFARLAAAYRVPPAVNYVTVQRHLRFRRAADGAMLYDWTDVDPYLRIMRQLNCDRVNINFSCNWHHWPTFFEKDMWYLPPGRRQARFHVCADPMGEYGRFLQDCFEHLVSLGWDPDDLYYVGADEPWAQKVRDDMRPAHELARRVLAKVPRSAAAAHPGMTNIADLIEIWCPQVREFAPDAYANDPRELWLYTCGWKFPPYPCYSVPVPGVATRITGWICRKYNVTSFLNWGMNVWEAGNDINIMRRKPFAEKRWVKDGWSCKLAAGDGVLLYPTPDGPIASQRLLCIRDGTEDYEYLTILRRLANEVKHAPADLLAEARTLAAVPAEIVTSTTEWTTDAARLEATRRRAAELIVELGRRRRSAP